MKVLCIIQARMGSSRLPGKVLREVSGKPLIVHSLDRLKRCRLIDHIILATSSLAGDKPLLDVAQRERVEGFAGSEDDVLERYYQAARPHSPQVVVRVTGDCPMLDSQITDFVIQEHLRGGADYTSNALERSYPRGYDTEVFNWEALQRAAHAARSVDEREHVTPYIYQHPELFKIKKVIAPPDQYDPALRLCVDTVEDFKLIEEVFNALYPAEPFFGIQSVLGLFKRRPELRLINAHIEQKKI